VRGILLPACLAGTAAGILLGDAGLLMGGAAAVLPAGGGLLVLGGWLARRRVPVALGAAILAIQVGAWRASATALPVGPGSVAALIDGATHALSGTVAEEPRPRGERQQAVLDDLAAVDPDHLQTLRGRVLVWMPRGVALRAGDRVEFDGELEEPRDFDGFAYREYLARQGIGATSSAYGAVVHAGSRGALVDGLDAIRRALLAGLLATVPEPEGALGAGILLGARAGIAPEVADAFTAAGLTHVVAISGWNIAIVAAVVGAATRPLLRVGGGRVAAASVAAIAVTGYVLITGASPSVVRAALMAGALVLARLGGSPAHAISGLMLAALGMLVAAPQVLWDVGFQLSALATAGLIWFAAPLEKRLARWPALVREPVALTLAAQLTTLPVILLNFERLSLVSPIANVVVVPLVPIVMACSAAAAVAGALDGAIHLQLVGDLLVWACGGAAWLYLRLMILAGQAAAAVPLASVAVAAPAWLAVAWYPALFLLHRRWAGQPDRRSDAATPRQGRTLGARWAAAATLAAIGVLTLASQPDGRLHLVMLDIGQGDAMIVRAPDGATMLVDGGPDPDLAARRLGEVLPFWQRTLDIVLLTHPHEDHVAGLVPALERFRVGIVLDPGRDYGNPTYDRFLELSAAEPSASYRLARAGMTLRLGGVDLTVLYPSDADAGAPLPDGDINNASVVLLVTQGSFRALLTGDAEAPVEASLLARGLVPRVDLLKVGHHGSDSSSTPAFLAALQPRLALISVGAGNEYGHPHASTLEQLGAIDGLEIRRTDLDGTIDIAVENGRMRTSRRRAADAGSIGPWPCPTPSARRRSSRRTSCRRGSSVIRAALHASPARRRRWSPRPAFRWMPTWSRPPPSCTTSTSRTRVTASGTGSRRPPR
jgi:competence protein ComEC